MNRSAGFPTIVPASAIGRGRRTSPGNRIVVGVVGTGKMANDYHLPSLLDMEDVQVVAVCEVDTKRRLAAKDRVASAYSTEGKATCDDHVDYRDLVSRRDIDAVLIATPEHQHALPILEAFRHGKDVYCEKPMTLTLTEAKRCMEIARARKRVFQTGSQQRSNVFGAFREGCEFVRSGRIGRVLSVTVGVAGPSVPCDLPAEPMEPGLDWDRWLGPAPKRPYSSVLSPRGNHNHFPAWRNYREYSGGGHADMGAHFYDIVQWALGKDDTGPVEIIPPSDPKATSGVLFRYADGIEVTHGGPSGCVFTGTRGTLYLDRGVLRSDPPDLIREPLGAREVHLFRSPGHHRNWIDCIRSRERPVCDVEIGARSNAFTQLGNIAYRLGRRVRWDPDRWDFVGDRAASGLMDYERRRGWALPTS
ncbi:MAG: Gfo/Idh/MocA family protein [Armatimonadota bacterium]